MSDNTSDEEQQQQMEEISICADIWLEIFALFSPLELGQLMALISDRFDRLVAEHFKTRKWSLGRLQIVRSTNGNGAQIVNNNQQLPIPQRPLPNKVIGFEKIDISYIDRSAIDFLQRIRRLFNSSGTIVYITTSVYQSRRSWRIILRMIWPLINDNIRYLRLGASALSRLRQFSPTILRNCAKLRSIDGLFPEFPADDNANASSNKAVAKWLLTPRQDGRPKVLYCDADAAGMEGLKGAFVTASEPANFIICLAPCTHIFLLLPFELTNNLTGERLELRRRNEDWRWLLVRCPIERDEDKWAEWEKAIELKWWSPEGNCIGIHFEDSDIGDGMLPRKQRRPKK